MLKVGRNENITLEDLLNDQNKYRFTFDADLAFDSLDMIEEELWEAYDNNDTEEFIDIYNSWANSFGQLFKIKKIYSLYGPGAGWPDVLFETTKLMTPKEAMIYVGAEYSCGDIDEGCFCLFGEEDNLVADVVEVAKN